MCHCKCYYRYYYRCGRASVSCLLGPMIGTEVLCDSMILCSTTNWDILMCKLTQSNHCYYMSDVFVLQVWLSLFAGTHGHVQCFWVPIGHVSLISRWMACCCLRVLTRPVLLVRWCSVLINYAQTLATSSSCSPSGSTAGLGVTPLSSWRRPVIAPETTASVRRPAWSKSSCCCCCSVLTSHMLSVIKQQHCRLRVKPLHPTLSLVCVQLLMMSSIVCHLSHGHLSVIARLQFCSRMHDGIDWSRCGLLLTNDVVVDWSLIAGLWAYPLRKNLQPKPTSGHSISRTECISVKCSHWTSWDIE